jgi:hypothetical protein
MPRGRGKVVIEVSKELRDRIRELAEKHGLLYEDLIWKALDVYTQSNPPVTQGSTQLTQSKVGNTAQSMVGAITQSKKHAPSGPIQVSLWPNDPFWYLIRVGEGLYATEISLNTIQLSKLCNTGLLAEEVCEKAGRL